MARAAFSLPASLGFARREPVRSIDDGHGRPRGPVVWLHCSDESKLRAFGQLGRRLFIARGDLGIVLTAPEGTPAPEDDVDGVSFAEAPNSTPGEIAAFYDRWHPDIGLWLGPWLRPSLISEAKRRQIDLTLVDADEPHIENRRFRFLPEPTRATLRHFDTVFARSEAAATRLGRQVPDATEVHQSGQLLEEGPALHCDESDLDALRGALAGRPVWLAARIQRAELDAILSAHRATMRLSHRLVLVLVPDHSDMGADFAAQLSQQGWRVANWDNSEMPDDNTQIILASDRRELGLWFRVAPVSLMGSSLVSGHGGHNPMFAAALGSALLYGPGVGNYLESYTRLARAGAARIVRDGSSLAAALGLLSAPEQVAAMAQAGWETVTEGAETSDQIIAHVLDLLDAKGL